MTSLVHAENALDPGDDFMRGWIRGLVEVDDTRGDVGLQVSAVRVAADRYGCEVASADKDWEELAGGGWSSEEEDCTLVVVLEK